MQSNKFLAFDIGASSGRAITGSFKDNIISLKEIRRFYNGMTVIHGRYHWDIFRLFEEIKNGIKDAVTQNEIPVSIGIDTWGVDYGLLDEAGHVLGLPYAYRDHRTDSAMDEVFRIIPKEHLYNLTGIQFLQFNTIFQLHAAVRDRLPIMDIAKDLLFIPDLLNYLLGGVKKSEFSFATTSQLYNPRTKSWAPEIFEKIGVPMAIMQDIVAPGTIIGTLAEEIMKETGAPGINVASVASHDTGSAIAAIPAGDEDFAYISSGTWSLMGIESKTPIISPKSLAFNFTNEGGVGGTFRVLKNIMGLWLIQECKRSWADAGADFSYQALANMASSSKPFKTLIDPDHHSLLNPGNMPEALTSLVQNAKEPPMGNPGEFSRCIFESLAFRYRQTVEELKQISDKDIRKVHIIGGGSQNELLCQFTANATGLPVIAGPAEGTALGNIMVQAMAQAKIGSLSEIRRIIRKSFEFKEYFPESISEWNSNYSRFVEVCNRTKQNAFG
jgi:rhamnulokinase